MTTNNFDVIVVGAGVSGLTAAYHIKNIYPAAKIVVIEGKDRVGGRTLTVPLESSNGKDHWDLGGQWVGRSQLDIMKLLKILDIPTYPQFSQGFRLHQIGEVHVRKYTSEIPKLNLFALLDLGHCLNKIDLYQSQLSVEDPYSHSKAAEWDGMSLGAFLDKTLYTKAARRINEAAIRTIFGCEVGQISFLYYILYVHMSGGLKNIINSTDFTAQEYKIKGGAQQISEKLANLIGQDSVHLGDAVTSIQQTDSKVVVKTAENWTASASYIILAVPPKATEHISFSPNLSEDRIDFTKLMPMGNMIKVIITYSKFFWREKNLSGEIVSDGGEITVPGCTVGPLSITFDATSYNGCPALVAFLGGEAAVCWARHSDTVRKNGILDHLAVFFGQDVYNYLSYTEKNWNHEPYSWGGPVSYVTPGGVRNFARAIRRPEGRIHWAGTETATSWSGYISGAVQAGERSALEVLFRLKPSVLSNDVSSAIQHSLAKYEENQSSDTKAETRQSSKTVRTLISCSIGLGLVTVSAYLITYCVIKKEVSFGWLKITS